MLPADVVRQFLSALFDESLPEDAAVRFLHADARLVERPNAFLPGGRVGGRDGVPAGVRAGRELMAWQRLDVHSLVADGPEVAVRATWEGARQDDGALLRVHSGLFFRVEDGLIVEE